MSFLRKAWAPVASATAGFALVLGHAPPELVAIGAAGVGQLVGAMVPTQRSRDEVISDDLSRDSRAQAYETFGQSVALAWQAAGILYLVRPRWSGYVHTLALLVRAQRRFEDSIASSTAALANVLLYGSSETQQAALSVFSALDQGFTDLGGAYKAPTAARRRVHDKSSLDLGDAVVAWRRAAQGDLQAPR